jgi:hypothetical protein
MTYRVHRGRSGLRALPSARCAELSRAALHQRGPVRICRRRGRTGGLRGCLRVRLLYANYYNQARTHLSLNKDAPVSRAIQAVGHILPLPILGGLHHQYVRI